MGIFNNIRSLFKTNNKKVRNDSIEVVSFGGYEGFNFSTLDVSQHRTLSSLLEKVAIDLSQLQVAHWVGDEKLKEKSSNVLEVLQGRVNELETPSDLFSKIAYRLLVDSNVFIYIKRNYTNKGVFGKLEGLYIADYSDTQILRDEKTKKIFVSTRLENGESITTSYDNVIHLKRRYSKGVYGTPMLSALKSTLSLLDTNDVAIKKQLENANEIKGIIRMTENVNAEDLQTQKNKFIENTIATDTGSSIGILGVGLEYIDVKSTQKSLISLSKEQSKLLIDEVYRFFNISPNIVSGNYTAEEYSMYLQSIINPIAKQMSSEFTLKILTPTQRKNGQKILFSTIHNELGGIEAKGKFLKEIKDTGALTLNEARELLGKPPVENGDINRVSLNYVNHEFVDQYQLEKHKDKILVERETNE